MPELSGSQQSHWDSNIYILRITRVLVVIGVTYLARSLYQLVRHLFSTSHSRSTAARVNQGLELALGDLESGPSFSLTIGAEVDGLPSLRPPPPIFNPLFRSQRAQTTTPDRTHDDDSLIPPPITKLLDDHTVNAESHAGKEETDSAPCLDGGTRSEEPRDQDQREVNGSAD